VSKKKQAILRTATILFAEKGFNETAMADLAQMTEVAEGTIFYHFKTKTDLFLATLENVEQGILREFQDYVAGREFENGLEMMEAVIAFFLYLAGHREDWFLLLHRHYPYELARVNGQCRKSLESIYNSLLDLFEGAIIRGIQDGSIKETPTRKTALILFSMVNGLIWLKNHELYDVGSLYQELLASCRKLLITENQKR
jgi:AcrR family transcriptional regulator